MIAKRRARIDFESSPELSCAAAAALIASAIAPTAASATSPSLPESLRSIFTALPFESAALDGTVSTSSVVAMPLSLRPIAASSPFRNSIALQPPTLFCPKFGRLNVPHVFESAVANATYQLGPGGREKLIPRLSPSGGLAGRVMPRFQAGEQTTR